MTEKLTCIECPKGCTVMVELEHGNIISMAGQNCEKGKKYITDEINDPRRIVTTTIFLDGLGMRTLPVKTNHPVPKRYIFDLLKEARKIRISKKIHKGDIVVKNILGLGIDIVATRTVK